jgi:ribosomal-protein-alanine N-acetyltransferase
MYSVRPLIPSDAPQVSRILNAAFPHVGMTPEKMASRIARGAFFLVACSGPRVIGFAELRFRRTAFLRGLAVEPSWRSRGVGSALLRHGAFEAQRRGKQRISLKAEAGNPGALKLYAEAGFRQRASVKGSLGEDLILMTKRLAT